MFLYLFRASAVTYVPYDAAAGVSEVYEDGTTGMLKYTCRSPNGPHGTWSYLPAEAPPVMLNFQPIQLQPIRLLPHFVGPQLRIPDEAFSPAGGWGSMEQETAGSGALAPLAGQEGLEEPPLLLRGLRLTLGERPAP